jgi:endonuclease/exonuclease/phosphatase family metal-dependent hydrolase
MLLAYTVSVACSPASAARLSGDTTTAKTLRVLSYNAYLLEADANGGATLKQRLAKLPQALADTGADVIIMQEVWGIKNRSQLAEAMQALGYAGQAKETPSLWPPYHYGNGLYIFVKAPLTFVGQPVAKQFPATSMLNFDGFTTKGVVVTKVAVPDVGNVSVAAAHTGYLPFDKDKHEFDLTQEDKLMTQVKTITDAVAAADTDVKILGIDVNTPPQHWDGTALAYDMTRQTKPYAAFLAAGLTDAMGSAESVTCGECSTWDNDRNAFIKAGHFAGTPGVDTDPNERIDYVFFSGSGVKATTASLALEAEHEFVVDGVIKQLPLADHYGVFTELSLP